MKNVLWTLFILILLSGIFSFLWVTIPIYLFAIGFKKLFPTEKGRINVMAIFIWAIVLLMLYYVLHHQLGVI